MSLQFKFNQHEIESGVPFIRCGVTQGRGQDEQHFWWRVHRWDWTLPDKSDAKTYVLGFNGWRQYDPGVWFKSGEEVFMLPWEEFKAYLEEMAEADRKTRE